MAATMEQKERNCKPAVLRLSLSRENTWQSSASARSNYHISNLSPFSSSHLAAKSHRRKSGAVADAGPRQVVLWLYSNPTRLYLTALDKSNPVSKIRSFLENTLDTTPDTYTLSSLVPGSLYPVPLMRFSNDVDKGIILCLPTTNVNLTIQQNGKGNFSDVFSVQANLLVTVQDLKTQINSLKGYPVVQQDLLYNGHALINYKQLLDYNLTEGAKLSLVLQPSCPFGISVETFYDDKYSMDVDPCMPVGDVMMCILRRVFKSHSIAEFMLQQVSLYNHLLLLQHNGEILDKDTCLNFNGVKAGSVIHLVSTSELRHENQRQVTILVEDRILEEVSGAPYDTWFMVALRIHGKTKVHLDRMQLFVNDRETELQSTLGSLKMDDDLMHVRVVLEPAREFDFDFECSEMVSIDVKLPSKRMETLNCSLQDSVRAINEQLENTGLANAMYYDIIYKKVRLPRSSKLSDYKLQDKCHMDMRLGEFPIAIVQANASSNVTARPDRAVSDLLRRIEEKVSCSPIKTSLIHAGHDLYNFDLCVLSSMEVYVKAQVFVEPIQAARVLHLVTEGDVIPIPVKQNLDAVHVRQLQRLVSNLESFIASIQWFTKWRYRDDMTMFGYRKNSSVAHRGLGGIRNEGLHSKLEAVREGRLGNGSLGIYRQNTWAGDTSAGSIAIDPRHHQAECNIINSLTNAKPAHRKTSLPLIGEKDGNTCSPTLEKSPTCLHVSHHIATGAPSNALADTPVSKAPLSSTRTPVSPALPKKKLQVRFDIPEAREETVTNEETSAEDDRSRDKKFRRFPNMTATDLPKPIWQTSTQFLSRQTKASTYAKGRQLSMDSLARAATDISQEYKSVASTRNKYKAFRAYQSYSVPMLQKNTAFVKKGAPQTDSLKIVGSNSEIYK